MKVFENEVRSIGEQLKAARNEKEISQKTLVIRTGIAQKTISRIENGLDNPRASTVIKLARAMGMELILVEDKDSQEKREFLHSND